MKEGGQLQREVISSLRMTTSPNPIDPLCDNHYTPLNWAGFVPRRHPEEEPPVGAYACSVNCGRVYGVTYGYCDFPTVPIDDKPEPYGNRVIKECLACVSMMYIRAYDAEKKEKTWVCEGEGKHEQIVKV
jgi:hypothetical protein